jgi:hypothetical protein
MKIKDIEVIKEGTLSIDVPNEAWLQDKIDYAKSKGRNSYGVPYMGSTTAHVRGTPPRVRVMRLASLPGMRNEQTNVRKDDLKWLMDYMDTHKKLPPMGSNPDEEYLPYIMVAYNGEAWVNEGNHRIMAAYRLNWPDMPVEIRYFDGGERVKSGSMYPGKIGLGEVETPKSESMTEIFEPGKQNWKWRRQSSDEAFASFLVGDREYQWHAFSSEANTTKWEIQFRLMRVPADPDGLDLFGQTGTGNSAQVLSTAVDITRAFLQAYGLDKVEEITFNAKEDSRIDLYAKMIKRLLPTWHLSSRKSLSHGMQFTLTDPRAYDKPENKVTEAFDQPYPLTWEKSEADDSMDALARLPDGSNLSIMFNMEYDEEGEEVIQVEFHRNNSQEVTGDGDAQRVFATVLAAIQQYIKAHNPKRLTFSASKEVEPDQNSESRAKLYDRLVIRYARTWGYRPLRADTGSIVRYELSRIKPLNEYLSQRQTIIQSFVNGPSGQKYKQHDCKTVTRAFVRWAEQNKIPTQVVSLAPPSADFIAKNPQFKGKSGEGDGHIMPIVNGSAIDFTVRQFGVNRPFNNPLVTPINSLPAVYGKFGYFTDKPEWFLGGKTHWIGSLNSIPPAIFNQNFGDEMLEHTMAENFADGRNPQDKGDSQRHGIPKGASMAELEKAAKASGRKGQLARWQLNMRRGRKKANESTVMEGGWASTETQNTVITPRIVAEIVHILDGFEASYNAWQAANELDTEIKIGNPKGSGTYYRRDLEQDPNREYGDVDVECFIHSREGVKSAQRITEYRDAIKSYCDQSPDFSTDNGTNVIMRTTAGPVQVDLIYTYHEHADWSRVLSPEYRVKGVISTSLTSSIAEALNLSFSSQGIQVKIRNNQPVSFRQSRDTELRTVSINPDNWAQDIYSLYYYLSHGEKPETMPRDLRAHGGLKDEQRLSDIVLSIKALATGLEQANLLGHGALIDIADKKDLIRRVAQIYSAKLESAETSSKFDKASTPAAVEKAKKTKLMLAKYRNEVTKLLLN